MDAIATRPNTPIRWAAALDRARSKGIKLFHDVVDGHYYALSSDGHTLYPVSAFSCACIAAVQGDPVCVHRAALRSHLTQLDAITEQLVDEPTPTLPQHLADLAVELDETGEPSASEVLDPTEPDHRMCTDCLDTGWARMYVGFGLNDYTEIPCRCGVAAVTA